MLITTSFDLPGYEVLAVQGEKGDEFGLSEGSAGWNPRVEGV
jgi:hypothetical protein